MTLCDSGHSCTHWLGDVDVELAQVEVVARRGWLIGGHLSQVLCLLSTGEPWLVQLASSAADLEEIPTSPASAPPKLVSACLYADTAALFERHAASARSLAAAPPRTEEEARLEPPATPADAREARLLAGGLEPEDALLYAPSALPTPWAAPSAAPGGAPVATARLLCAGCDASGGFGVWSLPEWVPLFRSRGLLAGESLLCAGEHSDLREWRRGSPCKAARVHFTSCTGEGLTLGRRAPLSSVRRAHPCLGYLADTSQVRRARLRR